MRKPPTPHDECNRDISPIIPVTAACLGFRMKFSNGIECMKTRTVTREEVNAKPFCIWNAYVDFLAMEDYEDLTPEQRRAHLVFWYESEMQNGGHLQYFENRGAEHLEETVYALGLLGAKGQQEVLREAGAAFTRRNRPGINRVEDLISSALEGDFTMFDSRFHACSPTLQECLEAYLARHQSSFVTIV